MTTVDLVGDDRVQKFLRLIQGSAESRIVRTALGEEGSETVRENLYEKDKTPNKLGGDRTHFYRQAGDATGFALHPEGATVFINKLGILQRLNGGVITPKTAKNLAIPIAPEAHGKRPREFDLDLAGRFLVDSSDKALFVLKKRVDQPADPSVLPTQKKLTERSKKRVFSTIELLLQRN